jgi:hypothetical protein
MSAQRERFETPHHQPTWPIWCPLDGPAEAVLVNEPWVLCTRCGLTLDGGTEPWLSRARPSRGAPAVIRYFALESNGGGWFKQLYSGRNISQAQRIVRSMRQNGWNARWPEPGSVGVVRASSLQEAVDRTKP